ncbi:MAG: hypothetical protein ACAI44_38265, partial [Candidatus Sericytochromatia bacterium]
MQIGNSSNLYQSLRSGQNPLESAANRSERQGPASLVAVRVTQEPVNLLASKKDVAEISASALSKLKDPALRQAARSLRAEAPGLFKATDSVPVFIAKLAEKATGLSQQAGEL